MRILVDSNVFLDFLLGREGADEAEAFFANCQKLRMKTYVSAMSLRDIGYIAHRFFHSEEIARKIRFETYQVCTKVIDITANDAINALHEEESDFEDSLLVNVARSSMLDIIVTNNTRHLKKYDFPCISVIEINKIFASL